MWGQAARDAAPGFTQAGGSVRQSVDNAVSGLTGYRSLSAVTAFGDSWAGALAAYAKTVTSIGEKLTASANTVHGADTQSRQGVQRSGQEIASVDVITPINGTTWENVGN